MTALPADRVGLADRGRLLPGCKADVVVFDLATLADRATFEEPKLYPAGIERVFVNGVAVVDEGAPTGARPGRMLRRS
jgi:N-acyl-D-aspartate/D-glutamate deacylase